MQDYLVFQLYGPMASWGQAAVGGDRPTGLFPGRSSVLGLLGAALGIKRDNAPELTALAESILISVKQVVPSSLVRDYHTTQVPSHSKKVTHLSRKSEVTGTDLNTILSSRDYRCDGRWVIALSLAESAGYTLEQLRQALLQPVFALSLGRKSCPPALPLAPRVVTVESLRQALDQEFPPLTRSNEQDKLWLGHTGLVTYYWEGDKSQLAGANALTTQPWDVPLSRERWQFSQRVLHQITMEET
ncbi:type I-E CRISPR-associated protein Cas5/CasD [Teredinibacter turnerae]|uniref:type I-E CRISPR-associated protein Cas5/CasD n=1 Tax=Teredinibacter turnerae TaxID=2426 RepID=UPI000375A031|nr:type I-E CRISPR-associated protein Cas5/CasD [Teredinibacter turnerae]